MALQPGQTCPDWQYTRYPDHDAFLKARAAAVAARLRKALPSENEKWCADTRTVHGPYFYGLTPPGFDHYAGHYRGESLDCIDEYEVTIPSDPIVGYPAATVPTVMNDFARDLQGALIELDRLWRISPNIIGK